MTNDVYDVVDVLHCIVFHHKRKYHNFLGPYLPAPPPPVIFFFLSIRTSIMNIFWDPLRHVRPAGVTWHVRGNRWRHRPPSPNSMAMNEICKWAEWRETTSRLNFQHGHDRVNDQSPWGCTDITQSILQTILQHLFPPTAFTFNDSSKILIQQCSRI